ncbi:hypothetical protein BAUCODRAFT_23882 [Baudoinia panamericana UAMH 10762]|uniref:Uncharacterized protein n=1 Tax=Baudoinia panamericana (strain UAMH 10762) TaxID=717646 RepID=M2MLT3_BAUPA|nr:uncharacterized protein BAUCODRAFT_23882 [Baudoinia panamericana UAMH 10762]EMC97621.1 hypothetical protein BAUCODRAFT_23882 [Baudoinia panamericana UAMH 10762]
MNQLANVSSANATISANTTLTTATFVHGWVSSPNGRGTLDIVQTPQNDGWLAMQLYKTKWVLFTLYFPELMPMIAAEQAISSAQSFEDFDFLRKALYKRSRQAPPGCVQKADSEAAAAMHRSPWTRRHSFFADMGGLRLRFSDHPDFPVNSHQLFWLVKNGHLDYPQLDPKDIEDKNKADIFARIATLLQIAWFTIQNLARAIQHQALTTFELVTLAFAFCTLLSFWLWRAKPADVTEPMTLDCRNPLATIIQKSRGSVGMY